MREMILKLAKAVSEAGEAEEELLELLCEAAERMWSARLRDGVAATDCGTAFPCAVAFTAAADLTAGRSGGSVSAFTAGEISVSGKGNEENTKAAAELRRTAERLMLDYARSNDFSFKGVRG